MTAIANNSQGVAGYHLNGEVADWGKLEEWQTAYDVIKKQKELHNDHKTILEDGGYVYSSG